MDTFIDNRFERVENALAKLIDSISKYNPSPALATDFVAVDAELSKGLEQLSTHQANYSKILSLRNTSGALDQQIRETLTLLTDIRRALLNTPSTTFPEATNPVSYSELLSYARRISKNTIPPTHREPEAPSAETSDVAAGQGISTPKESKSETHTNGTTTPVAVVNGVDKDTQMSGTGITMEVEGATSSNDAAQTSQDITASNTAASQYLVPSEQLLWVPWPSEEVIKKGALNSIQVLLDKGIDPATFDPERSAELEAERKRIVEEEDRVQEEQRARMEEERRREMERRMSATGPSTTQNRMEQEPPKVFQLEEFDEDDSE